MSKEERFEILVLKKENTELKDELQTTKDRNKKLLAILTHGEMKEKAKLILEAEKLTAVSQSISS